MTLVTEMEICQRFVLDNGLRNETCGSNLNSGPL
jgi:hypothetical protein